MSIEPAPFVRFYDLADLSDAGYEKSVVTDEKDRARLAEWAEVEAVESFASFRGGKGGYWEDLGYAWYAGI